MSARTTYSTTCLRYLTWGPGQTHGSAPLSLRRRRKSCRFIQPTVSVTRRLPAQRASPSHGGSSGEQLPNKRLKLAGGDRSKGNGGLCPWRGTVFVPRPSAGGRVPRSLSPIGQPRGYHAANRPTP